MEIPIWVWVEENEGGSPRYAATNSVERLQVLYSIHALPFSYTYL